MTNARIEKIRKLHASWVGPIDVKDALGYLLGCGDFWYDDVRGKK